MSSCPANDSTESRPRGGDLKRFLDIHSVSNRSQLTDEEETQFKLDRSNFGAQTGSTKLGPLRTYDGLMKDVGEFTDPKTNTFPMQCVFPDSRVPETVSIQLTHPSERLLVHGRAMTSAIIENDVSTVAAILTLQTLHGKTVHPLSKQDTDTLCESIRQAKANHPSFTDDFNQALNAVSEAKKNQDVLSSFRMTTFTIPSLGTADPLVQSIKHTAARDALKNVMRTAKLDRPMNFDHLFAGLEARYREAVQKGLAETISSIVSSKSTLIDPQVSEQYVRNLVRNSMYGGYVLDVRLAEAALGKRLVAKEALGLRSPEFAKEQEEYLGTRADQGEAKYKRPTLSFLTNDPLISEFQREVDKSIKPGREESLQDLVTAMRKPLRTEVIKSLNPGTSSEALDSSLERSGALPNFTGRSWANFWSTRNPYLFARDTIYRSNPESRELDRGSLKHLLPPRAVDVYNRELTEEFLGDPDVV